MSFLLAGAIIGSAVIGGIGSYLSGKSASKTQKDISSNQMRRLSEIAGQLQQPEFDLRDIPYQDLQLLGEYIPEFQQAILRASQVAPEILQYQNIGKYVEEAKPTTIQGKSPDAVAMREAQKEVLNTLKTLSREGIDQQTEIQSQKALNDVATAFQGQQQTITEGMARRGQLGSGAELAQRLASTQQASDLASKMAMENVLQANQRRAGALSQQANLASQIRGEELGMESQNVGIINAFNQRTAARQQEQGRYEADMRNRQAMAQQEYQNYATNVANQDIAYNTALQNQVAQANVAERNRAQQQNLANAQSLANANVLGRREAEIAQRNYANQMAQQAYQNATSKANLEAGIANTQAQQASQANQMNQQANQALIQAGAQAITSGASMYDNYLREQELKALMNKGA